jgi:hypothetical protein
MAVAVDKLLQLKAIAIPMTEGPWCRFRREARAVSDIDTVVADSLKALDPNGRLEKLT